MTRDEMDDLERRLRKWVSYNNGIPSQPEICKDAADAIAALRAEVERLWADAKRYRWLRDVATPSLCRLAHINSRTFRNNFSTPIDVLNKNVVGDVDGAIDAARAALGAEK